MPVHAEVGMQGRHVARATKACKLLTGDDGQSVVFLACGDGAIRVVFPEEPRFAGVIMGKPIKAAADHAVPAWLAALADPTEEPDEKVVKLAKAA